MVDSIVISNPVPEEKYGAVIQHLRNNFFADEPLNKAVKLCDQGEKHDDLEAHSLETLSENLSVMAIDKDTNEIVGVALNGIQKPDDAKTAQEKLLRANDEKYKNIFSFLYGINHDLDLFSKYHVDSIFECRILSVDQNYRGQGLAKRLLEKSVQVAQEATYKLFKQDATSYYTQKIAESMGFVTVFELRYKAYRRGDGKPIFETSEPHKFLKVMGCQFFVYLYRLFEQSKITIRRSRHHKQYYGKSRLVLAPVSSQTSPNLFKFLFGHQSAFKEVLHAFNSAVK